MKKLVYGSVVAVASLALTSPVSAAISIDANTGINVSAGSSSAQAHDVIDTKVEAHLAGEGGGNATSSAMLEAHAKGLMNADSHLSGVSETDSTVTVAYKVPGKFLGIFPVRVTAHITADADGNASVSYPWYDFLTSVNDASMKAEVQSTVSQHVAANASANGTLSANAKTALVDSIRSTLSAWVSTKTSASVEGSTQ